MRRTLLTLVVVALAIPKAGPAFGQESCAAPFFQSQTGHGEYNEVVGRRGVPQADMSVPNTARMVEPGIFGQQVAAGQAHTHC
jgi:hypothetical protein